MNATKAPAPVSRKADEPPFRLVEFPGGRLCYYEYDVEITVLAGSIPGEVRTTMREVDGRSWHTGGGKEVEVVKTTLRPTTQTRKVPHYLYSNERPFDQVKRLMEMYAAALKRAEAAEAELEKRGKK